MKTFSRVIPLTALLLLLLSPALHASEITDKVKLTVDGILNILREESLKGTGKQKERRSRIRSLIHKRFNFEEMSRRSLARHWKKRSDKEKKEFVSLFGILIEDSYIEKIEGYTDEEILYTGEKRDDGRAAVMTMVITKGTEIPINYRLIKKKGREWMVYDIVIEGVSLVSTYRSQFNSTIRTSSFEGLVNKLREKTAGR